ncbi:MAG: FKBP-type peptidyl-prolyl cis-trans isomerase [Cyclobacteriaceae bacterium]|nr:FKBP-type peptidyl-prolyl cis-trans isomerase [Cyclobacteriaceae bacterium]
MTYKNENDSTLYKSEPDQPAMVQYDSIQWNTTGPLFKAFKIIGEGDSILIKIPTKVLFDESFRAPIPQEFDTAGHFVFYIGASKILTEEEAQQEAMAKREKMMEEAMAASAEQTKIDGELIDKYLAENNITAQTTESGLRYVIEEQGTGEFPQEGQTVHVHYTGTLMDGTKFDSSYDRNDGPLTFALGQGQVIPGWDEGIALLKKGGKGTLYIPSSLAYGPNGAGGAIPPNSNLKFEVELVDIE